MQFMAVQEALCSCVSRKLAVIKDLDSSEMAVVYHGLKRLTDLSWQIPVKGPLSACKIFFTKLKNLTVG